MNNSYKALVSEFDSDGNIIKSIKICQLDQLPANDVLIEVHYSSLNYKDTLSANGHKGITRNYPHTPGIDAAGVVVRSNNESFKEGDEVLVTGYDLGMNTAGGFAEYISVPSKWIVPLPSEISMREAMIYGTAGFTAASAIYEFQNNGIIPTSGKVLVNGATGGVATMAIAMLSKLGYQVTAATGKVALKDYLIKNGAFEVISRDDINDKTSKAVLPKKWIAALDNVGGNTLSTILKSIDERGVVCNCGMVESIDFTCTVFPFILRGVRLIGIASAETPYSRRLEIWNKIFNEYRLDTYNFNLKEITLDSLISEIDLMSKGEQVGRILVKIK